MSEETLFESERETSAAEAAATLRHVAAAIEDDVDLTFGDVTVPGPTDLELEMELEREREDGETEYELELELEWETDETAAADAQAVEAAAGEGDEAEADEEAAGDDPDGVAELTAPGEAVDMTSPGASKATFEVFRDRADEWRWRLVHRNGQIVADSGEGYSSRTNVEKGLRSVKRNAPGAPVEYESDEE